MNIKRGLRPEALTPPKYVSLFPGLNRMKQGLRCVCKTQVMAFTSSKWSG